MAKVDRWMPLYVSHYLAETAHLTLEEHGAYLLLQMNYVQNGELPRSDREIAKLVGVSTYRWRRKIWPFIKGYFRIESDGKIRHDELDLFISSEGKRLPLNEWMALRREIFERDDYTCSYCGQRGGELECDHIIPLARGGSNLPDNLATACMRCNRSKGATVSARWGNA